MNEETNFDIYDGEDETDVWSVEETMDIDGDGFEDVTITDYDYNEDGYVDVETMDVDLDSDGNIDLMTYSDDVDYDGDVDLFMAEADTNADGMADIGYMESDTNNDGMVDYAAYVDDVDYDGNADIVITEADTNYDGATDYVEVSHITYNEDGSTTVFNASATDTDFDGQFDDFNYDINDFPAEDDVVTYEEPVEDIPVYEEPEEIVPPSYEEPVEEAPVYDEPVEETPVYEEPVEEAPVYEDSETVIPVPSYEETTPVSYDDPEDNGYYTEPENSNADDANPFDVLYSEDSNNDGNEDFTIAEIDVDGDGIADGMVYAKDIDFDGKADVVLTRLDTDGDGDFDYSNLTIISNEEDGSSTEYFITAQDLDNDGHIDDIDYGSSEFTAEENEGLNIFDILNGDDDTDFDQDETNDSEYYGTDEDSEDYEDLNNVDYDDDEESDEPYYEFENEPDYDDTTVVLPVINYDSYNDNGSRCENFDNFDPDNADTEGIMGDPEDAVDYWESQGNTMRCALYAQKFVIEERLGIEVDVEDLVEVAEDNGWFVEGSGTPITYMDKMLDYYGVPNEVSYNNTIEDLAESLNDGHRVIVSVDADEYWYGENDGEVNLYTPNDGINHAIEVIGIDASDPDNVVVIVNDSGTPNGQGLEIPVESFMDAWEDGNYHMIEC